MRTREDFRREDVVRRLSMFGSVVEIERRLRESSDDPALLVGAAEHAADRAAQAGRPAEAALLHHVATIVGRMRPARSREARHRSRAVRGALRAAHDDRRPMAGVRALRAVRHELDEDDFRDLCNDDRGRPTTGREGLTALHLVSLVLDLPGPRIDALLRIAYCAAHKGDRRSARRRYRQAGLVAQKSGDDTNVRAVETAKGTWLYTVGDLNGAAQAFEWVAESLDAASERRLGERLADVEVWRYLATTYDALGRRAAASGVASRALELVEEIREKLAAASAAGWAVESALGREAIEVLNDRYVELGLLAARTRLGVTDIEGAERHCETVIKESRRLGLVGPQFQALYLLAECSSVQGDHDKEERRLRYAVDVAWEFGDASLVCASYNNLGAFLLGRGDLGSARETYLQAVFHAGNAGLGARQTATALIGLGETTAAQGEEAAASTTFRWAADYALQAGEDLLLALVAKRMFDDAWWAESGASAVMELALYQHAPARSTAELERVATMYAARRRRDGNPTDAVRVLRRGIELISDRTPQSFELVRLRLALGRHLAEAPGGRTEAMEVLTALLEEHDAMLDAATLDDHRASLLGEREQIYGAMIELLTGSVGEAADADSQRRACALHEAAKAERFAAELGAAHIELPAGMPRELVDWEQRALTILRAGETTEAYQSQAAARRLRETRKELRSCWEEMRPVAPNYVAMRTGRSVDVETVIALLRGFPCRAAVASFFCTGAVTVCFVVRPDRPMRVFQIDRDRAFWTDQGRALRRAVNGAPDEWPPHSPINRDRPRTLSALERLEEALVDVLDALHDVDLVYFCPHGPMHSLPLHAVRDRSGRYLVERSGVVYCPSMTALQYSLSRRPRRRRDVTAELLVGVASSDDPNPERFETVNTVQGRTPTLLLGARAATRERVLEELPHHHVVELICHGHFDDRRVLGSGLLLGNGERRPPRHLNEVPVRSRGQFLLTAEDLLEVKSSAELVVLRACSTGLVRNRSAGDDVAGPTRSLLQGGAGAVIASLWNVDQQSSELLLDRFRARWHAGADTWWALRQAQLDLLRSADPTLRHPYHWAGFALFGDCR